MKSHIAKAPAGNHPTGVPAFPQPQGGDESAMQLMDNRPEAQAQRELQDMINSSPRVMQLNAYQDSENANPTSKQFAASQTSKALDMASPVHAQTGVAPVQCKIMVGDDLWAEPEDMEGSALNTEAELASMLESIHGIDYLANPPADIPAAIADARMFRLWKGGGYYEASVGGVLENHGEPVDRQHLEVSSVPDCVERGELSQTMRISGLISCVAIILEATDDAGTQLLIGMHYVTGDHTPGEGGINEKGTSTLKGMEMLAGAYDITRVHLCFLPQIGGATHPYTVNNLTALRAHFGAGICQDHRLGQNHVTARLESNGTVTIDV
jgi:hypothetical protein